MDKPEYHLVSFSGGKDSKTVREGKPVKGKQFFGGIEGKAGEAGRYFQ